RPASFQVLRLLAVREEISRVLELLGTDHVAHRIFTIGDLCTELREQVAGGVRHLHGDQRIERSVAEEDAKPLPFSFPSWRYRREGEHGAHQTGPLEDGSEGHPGALAE